MSLIILFCDKVKRFFCKVQVFVFDFDEMLLCFNLKLLNFLKASVENLKHRS